MINTVSQAFKAKLANGEIPKIRMQFVPVSGEAFWLSDGDFWADGTSFTEATSANGEFSIGAAIIGAFNFTLNNFDGNLTNRVTKGAVVIPLLYFEIDGTNEYMTKGVYHIETRRTAGNLIRCTAYDGMKLLDEHRTAITYPITVQNLITTICNENGITLVTSTIPNGSYTIPTAPENQLTDRQMLSYACQITGNFAKMDENGQMVVGWYDTTSPVVIENTFEGKDLWTNSITITGVKGVVNDSSGETVVERTATYGSTDCMVVIRDNPYMTPTNLQAVVNMVGQRICGITFRPGSLPILSNPCIQAGDVLIVTDNITGNSYHLLATEITYTKQIIETVVCNFDANEENDIRPTVENITNTSIEQAKQKIDHVAIVTAAARSSAAQAAVYASRALGELSTVQSVAETLTWITQHGTMTLTTDTEIDPTHVYFVQDAQGDYVVGNVHYSVVAEPKAADLATYYILSIDESLNNYVATHLALTSEGLWVVPDSSGYKVLVSTGVSDAYNDAGIYIIGNDGSIVARFLTSRTTLTSNGGLPVFDISSNGTTEEVIVKQTFTGLATPQAILRPLPKTGTSVVVRYYYYSGDDIREGSTIFTGGTSDTRTWSAQGVRISYTRYSDSSYDKVSIRNIGTRSCGLTGVEYKVDAELPVFTLGTRDESEGVGGFSATIGEGLIASQRGQTVIGMYNVNDAGDDYVFIVGNGTADDARSNALTVDWNGNVKAAGHVSGTTEQLTITRTANSYVDDTSAALLKAVRKDGMLWFNGNINLSSAVPTGTGLTDIAKISGWASAYTVSATMAGQNGGGALLVTIDTTGSVKIANGSGASAIGFHRCQMIAPTND